MELLPKMWAKDGGKMKRQNKYNKKNTVQICLRLNKRTDADIIEFIELMKKNDISINGAIKKMFRVTIENYKAIKNYGGEKGEGDK